MKQRQKQQPIYYAATLKAELPAYVLQSIGAAGQELACEGCMAQVMVSRASMDEVKQTAERNCLEIRVLCPKCFDKQMSRGTSIICMYNHDQEVQSRVDRYVAEQN